MSRVLLWFAWMVSSVAVQADSVRWKDNGNQTLTDTVTGLVWTQYDNRGKIDWKGAMRYCDTLALADGHWRLPDADELLGIFSVGHDDIAMHARADRQDDNQGKGGYRISPLFHLMSFAVWSVSPVVSGKDDSAPRPQVFIVGARSPPGASATRNARALCVRRP